MTVAKKLLGSFMLGATLYIISVGTAYLMIWDLLASINDLKTMNRKVYLTGDLQLHLNTLLTPVAKYLAEGDPAQRDHYDREVMGISAALEELRRHKGDERWRNVLEQVSGDAVKLGEMAVEVLYIENPVGNKKAAQQMKETYLFSGQVIEEAGELHDITVEEMDRVKTMAEVEEKTAKAIFAAVLFISAAAFPSLYIYLSRFITSPIRTLHEGVKAIGGGTLGHRVTVKTGDELEALAGGFNDMAASLEEARKELDRRLLELYTLYNVSKVMNTTFETEQLLLRLVTDISKNLDIHRVMIMLIDERAQELYSASFTDFEKEGLKELRRKVGDGFYGLVAQTGMARLIRDVDTELNLPKEDMLSPDIRSIIAVPFGRRDKTLGLLCAFKDRPGTFEWHDLDLFRAVAEHVAVALENARLYHKTKMQAITDGLTGLYNHRFFREHLEVEMERADRYSHNLSLIILDIDNFKHYNDSYGHPQGDELLKELADLLQKCVRESDLACRYGGEEFALILPETNKEAATALAERLRKDIQDHPFPHKETQPLGAVTVSIGVAASPVDAKDMEKLIKKADDALYRAKTTGRNRVVAA